MTSTLTERSARADLAALTRSRVMNGVADLLTVGGGDFTFRALAAASGVPERTIFRHYATKEAVLAGFWTWINARLEVPAPPRSDVELIGQVPKLYDAFEAGEPIVRAMLHDPNGRAARLGDVAARRERMRVALEDVLEALPPLPQRRLLATVQLLFSATGWETMKDQWGLTAGEAADAAQWAIGALVAQARAAARKPSSMKRSGRGGSSSIKQRKG